MIAVDELADLIAVAHERWMPPVVEAIFGTDDPATVAATLTQAVASTLGVPVGTRTVLVRNVIRRDRRALIAVGGVLYRIAPCRDGRRMSTCLVRTDLAPTPDDLVPGGFASPPPPPPPRGLAEPEPGGE